MKANVQDTSKCLFVDDNLQNVQAAKRFKWGSCVYYREPGGTDGATNEEVDATINSLEELREVWPCIFKDAASK